MFNAPNLVEITFAYQLCLFDEIKQEGTGLCPVHLLPFGGKTLYVNGLHL